MSILKTILFLMGLLFVLTSLGEALGSLTTNIMVVIVAAIFIGNPQLFADSTSWFRDEV